MSVLSADPSTMKFPINLTPAHFNVISDHHLDALICYGSHMGNFIILPFLLHLLDEILL